MPPGSLRSNLMVSFYKQMDISNDKIIERDLNFDNNDEEFIYFLYLFFKFQIIVFNFFRTTSFEVSKKIDEGMEIKGFSHIFEMRTICEND